MKTILITGASGFFGKSLVEALQKTNVDCQFICVYNNNIIDISDPRFVFVQADLLDVSKHQTLMQRFKPTKCVHLAWYVAPQKFWSALENFEWMYASINLFKVFCENGGKFFLGAGSLAEYDWITGVLDEEKTQLNPQTIYGQSKKSLYEILKIIRDVYYKDVKLIWPRIGYFFGSNEPKQKLISKLVHNIKESLPLTLVNKDIKRPYVHVKYLGNILSKIILNLGEDIVFNLSATESYSLEEIVNFISAECGIQSTQIIYNAYKSSIFEPLQLIVNTEKMVQINTRQIPDTFFKDLRNMIRGE